MNVKMIGILLFLLILGCENNNIQKKYLTPNEFEMEYKESKIAHSIKSYESVFIKDQYVFLKKREMSLFDKNRWKEKILYTQFDSLKPEIQREISIDQNKNETKNEKISKEYILDFWNAFKNADFTKMKEYYNEKVTLLPRAMLSYKVLGINPKGFSYEAKNYSKKDIFKAYHNLEKELGGNKRWKYLFSDINMKVDKDSIELSTVQDSKNRVKPYILDKTARKISDISLDDIAFVVRAEQISRDKLIFVFSKDTHKIIAQTIILVFPGSHYFDGFK